MNKPNKCKNCQWYGKPYWSIINPCDNCPNENPIQTTITIDREKVFNEFVENVIDPIEQCQKLQQRIDKALGFLKNCNYKDDQFVVYIIKLLQGEDND